MGPVLVVIIGMSVIVYKVITWGKTGVCKVRGYNILAVILVCNSTVQYCNSNSFTSRYLPCGLDINPAYSIFEIPL